MSAPLNHSVRAGLQPRKSRHMNVHRWDRKQGAILLLTAFVGACSAGAAEDTPSATQAEETFTRVINVVVQEVRPEAFVEEISLTGTVEAARDVTIAAEESGIVREMLVARGAAVAEGQPILRIDDALLVPQVERARAEAALAQEQWVRRRRLFEEDQVGSELAYLEARLTAEQAAAQLRLLEERLARTIVRAPFAGVLEDRFVEVGSMVAPGAPVGRILQLNPVEVTAGVPERYAPDVRRGAEVRVSFDVLAGEFEGTVDFVGAAVDPASRTFPVEVRLPNPDGRIKPEMVADVSLVRRTVAEALVVPQEAVVRVSDGHAVYVVKSEGGVDVVEARRVVLGPSQRNLVAITSGLAAGERIVVVGQQQVANGDRVRIVEAG